MDQRYETYPHAPVEMYNSSGTAVLKIMYVAGRDEHVPPRAMSVEDPAVLTCPSRAAFAWEFVPELVHFHLGVLVFVEDACGRLPQRQGAELLVRVAPRSVQYPCEAALCHHRGDVVAPHASHLGLHTRLFRHHPLQTAVPNHVRPEGTFHFPPVFRAFTKTRISVEAASRLDGWSSAAKRWGYALRQRA